MNIKHPSKKLEAIFEACLWKFRLFALIPVIFGLLSSLNFFVVGSIEILEGLSHNFPHDYIDEHSFTKAVASIIGGVDHYLGLPEKIRLGHLLAETLVISFHFQVLCLGKCKVKSAETSKTR